MDGMERMWSGYSWYRWFAPPLFSVTIKLDDGGFFFIAGPGKWWYDVGVHFLSDRLAEAGVGHVAFITPSLIPSEEVCRNQ